MYEPPEQMLRVLSALNHDEDDEPEGEPVFEDDEDDDEEEEYGYAYDDTIGPGVLDTWAANWPDTITLGDAADEIDFDLFASDNADLVLVKGWVDTDDVVSYSIAELDANDAEDRFPRLESGLAAGGHDVPPVVVLPGEGLRDGNHRASLAQAAGLPRIPVYTVPDPQ